MSAPISRGTRSMLCMLCDTRIACPWEQEIEPVAAKAWWVELPRSDRRKSPHHVCPECARELFDAVAGDQ